MDDTAVLYNFIESFGILTTRTVQYLYSRSFGILTTRTVYT